MQAPPPSQKQAEEAQQARYSAEAEILALFKAVEVSGGGGGDDDASSLHAIKIVAILAALSAAIVFTSFRHPRDRSRSLLLERPDNDEISEQALPEAQRVFKSLSESELSDEQKAVLWSTWAYSKTANQIADLINSGKIAHEFADQGLTLKKVWISRSDAKVRKLHARLHGKTIPSEDDFFRWPLTGKRLRWPGDQDAPADATIGCRCVCLLSFASQRGVSETIRKITDYAGRKT